MSSNSTIDIETESRLGISFVEYRHRCRICRIRGAWTIYTADKWHHTCRWIDPKTKPFAGTFPCAYHGWGDIVERLIKLVTFGFLKPCAGCKGRRKWLNEHFPLGRLAKRTLCPEPKFNAERPKLLLTLPGHGELAGDMQYVFATVKAEHPDWLIDVVCCPKIGRTLASVTGRQWKKDGTGAVPNPRKYDMVRRLPWCDCSDPANKCLRDFFGIESDDRIQPTAPALGIGEET